MPSCYPVSRIREAERQALAAGRQLMPLARLRPALWRPGSRPVRRCWPWPAPATMAATPWSRRPCCGRWGTTCACCCPPARRSCLPMPPAPTTGGWPRGGTLSALEPGFVPGLVIDGLFGIGLNRPLGADWQALVDTVNRWGAPVLALDVPSGVDADTGVALGRPIQARWTLSFIARARGWSCRDPAPAPSASGIWIRWMWSCRPRRTTSEPNPPDHGAQAIRRSVAPG